MIAGGLVVRWVGGARAGGCGCGGRGGRGGCESENCQL